ncbi:hypothetical protein GOODEAATRI_032345, partial [Goodea atripinnis]
WWGRQEFAIPQNVLEIVYGQTICWIGTFYCPMLPAICIIKYFFIFYIKKVSLIKNCRPATRPFRPSSSNFFFLGVLLIGLALACLPIADGRDKRFLIQKLCQAQKFKSPMSKSQPRSPSGRGPSYHTSFSSNFSEAVFLAHSPPNSFTHV